jgi:YVTN family beta-propeller protein
VTVTNPGRGISNALSFTILGTSSTFSWMSVTVVPDASGKFGKFAYVTHSATSNVSMYSINQITGTLQSIGTVAAGTAPWSVAVDPYGKFAYVANEGSNDVSMYSINANTGTLESLGTVPAGTSPISVTVDPKRKFAYVANEGSNDVSMYSINTTTGTLEPLGPIAAGVVPSSVAVDPSGNFAYVTNIDWTDPIEVNTGHGGNISMYRINATSGILEPMGTTPTGIYPRFMAFDPSHEFAYTAICGNFERIQGDVSMYTIDATTGTLTLTGTIDAGSCPLSVAVHPSGKFAYAVNTGSDGGPDIEGVSMYTIDLSTGTLSSLGIVKNTGYCPSSIALDPSGKFAYVTNHCDNTVSMYSIDDATGALTLIGTIGT